MWVKMFEQMVSSSSLLLYYLVLLLGLPISNPMMRSRKLAAKTNIFSANVNDPEDVVLDTMRKTIKVRQDGLEI